MDLFNKPEFQNLEKVRIVSAILLLLVLGVACTHEAEDPALPWGYEQPQHMEGNASRLLQLDRDIKDGTFGDMHSLMIIKSGKVVFENYYNGYRRKDLHPLNRITQSVFTLMAHSALESADLNRADLVIDLFPEYADVFQNIPQKDRIQLIHLLDHTSGFEWNEWDFFQKAPNSNLDAMKESEDWVRYVLSTPMIREPGMEFIFNSGHAIILGAALNKQLDASLREYMERQLFDPLDIRHYQWDEQGSQTLNTASGLHLTTADIGKLGYLLLNEGNWYGQQVVPENWVDSLQSVKAQSQLYRVGKNWFKLGFNHPARAPLAYNDVLFSWGEGGQFLVVVPHLEMVVVITAGNYDDAMENQMFDILQNYIFPSFSYYSQPTVNP